MERQAKDGTVYKQVGDDAWEPVTRTAKDGTVYKKIGADDWSPMDAPTSSGASVGDKARATLEGYADSSSLGTLPYIKAGGEAATDWLAEKTLGVEADQTPFDDRVGKFREQGKDLQGKAPGYALAGQVAGFIAPGQAASKVVGVGLRAASKIPGIARAANAVADSGKAAELYRKAVAAKEAGKLGRAATLVKGARADLGLQGAKLGAEGAVLGAAYTPESGFSDVGARLQGAATGLATGAVMPASMRGARNVAVGTGQAVAKGATAGSKKLLSSLGGVSEEVIEKYLKDPERIRSASTADEIYDQVTGVVKRLTDDFDQKKIDHAAAKAHLDDVARNIKESRVDGKSVAMEEVAQARTRLDEAFKSQKQNLTEKASPGRVEPMIGDALEDLKSKVVKGSNESYDILRAQKEPVNFKASWDELKTAEDRLNVAGVGPATPQAKAAQAEIRGLRETLGQLPSKMSAADAKQVIQQIDNAEKIIYDARAFTSDVGRAFKSIRQGLDEQLKQNPEYKTKMLDVAENTGLLKNAEKQFGADSSRFNRLQNVARPGSRQDLETLQSLGKKAGGELPKAIDEMIGAQRTLKSPIRMEGIKQALPENSGLRTAEMQASLTKRLAKPREVQKAIERSSAFYKSRSAEANMKTAKALADKFKGFGEQSAESKLKSVGFGRKAATKTLKELSELADNDFVEAVSAARDAAAFTKTAFHGSRNVNLWSVLGALGQTVAGKAGAGGAAGAIFGGPVGMAVGAVTGAMMDSYGPAVTKKVLDGVIKMKGSVTPRSIEALDVPDSVKRDLIEKFRSSVMAGRAAVSAAESGFPKSALQEREQNSPGMTADNRSRQGRE